MYMRLVRSQLCSAQVAILIESVLFNETDIGFLYTLNREAIMSKALSTIRRALDSL